MNELYVKHQVSVVEVVSKFVQVFTRPLEAATERQRELMSISD